MGAAHRILIELEPRPVTIKEFSITKIDLPKVYFKVVCSTGTYIRSLANDFGKALGVGAYLSSLCRTRIGNFLLEDALSMSDFEEEIQKLKAAEPSDLPVTENNETKTADQSPTE